MAERCVLPLPRLPAALSRSSLPWPSCSASSSSSPSPLLLPRCFRRVRGGAAVSARAMSSPSGADSDSASSSSSSFGSRMEDAVRKTLADSPVVVYSKSWCSYCMEVKALFKRIGVDPHVVELDQLGPQGPQLQKVLERLTGQGTVPNVFIGGKHIGGCTDTVKLYRKGELAAMLSELNISTKNV